MVPSVGMLVTSRRVVLGAAAVGLGQLCVPRLAQATLVRGLSLEELQGLRAILGGADLVPVPLEQPDQQLAAHRVVVGDQYRRPCRHGTNLDPR